MSQRPVDVGSGVRDVMCGFWGAVVVGFSGIFEVWEWDFDWMERVVLLGGFSEGESRRYVWRGSTTVVHV